MNKLIVLFRTFEGTSVKRMTATVPDRAVINLARAIQREFMAGLYQHERNLTYSALTYWEADPKRIEVYTNNACGPDTVWQWIESYVPTTDDEKELFV